MSAVLTFVFLVCSIASIRSLKRHVTDSTDQAVKLTEGVKDLAESVDDLSSHIALAEARWKYQSDAEAEANRVLAEVGFDYVQDDLREEHVAGTLEDISQAVEELTTQNSEEW